MQAIVTRYHGPTDTRGARISATTAGNGRVYTSYQHNGGDAEHLRAALKMLDKNKWGWKRIVQSTAPNGDVIFTNAAESEIIHLEDICSSCGCKFDSPQHSAKYC